MDEDQLHKKLTRGENLLVDELIVDLINCTILISYTPDPDTIKQDRSVKFTCVSDVNVKGIMAMKRWTFLWEIIR